MKLFANQVATIRINLDAKEGRRVRLVPLKSPMPSERLAWAALARLLRNLDVDLGDCSCEVNDQCPACALRSALFIQRRGRGSSR